MAGEKSGLSERSKFLVVAGITVILLSIALVILQNYHIIGTPQPVTCLYQGAPVGTAAPGTLHA